jgi:hypothetical protein
LSVTLALGWGDSCSRPPAHIRDTFGDKFIDIDASTGFADRELGGLFMREVGCVDQESRVEGGI